MSTIYIVKGHANGRLEFEVDNMPCNGNIKAAKNEKVHWRVKAADKSVKHIHEIRLNPRKLPGVNKDIFEPEVPAPDWFSRKKKWTAEVNSMVLESDGYHYDRLD